MAREESRSVERWDPFADFWSPFRDFGLTPRLARMPEGALTPAVDVAEDDERYVVTAEVPGAKAEDVHVEVQDNVLSIRGEKRSERKEEGERRRYVERRFGSFARSFSLPANADADRVKASFQDGVLTVEIPKAEESKPRVISIQS